MIMSVNQDLANLKIGQSYSMVKTFEYDALKFENITMELNKIGSNASASVTKLKKDADYTTRKFSVERGYFVSANGRIHLVAVIHRTA